MRQNLNERDIEEMVAAMDLTDAGFEDGAELIDDDYEFDGQPDEYTEWQDYMGGDEYYDHSENCMGDW